MTYAEAVQEALRRDGASEEEIKVRTDFANVSVPNNEINRQLKPEEVESTIQNLREFHAALKKLSPLARSLLLWEANERTRALMKQN